MSIEKLEARLSELEDKTRDLEVYIKSLIEGQIGLMASIEVLKEIIIDEDFIDENTFNVNKESIEKDLEMELMLEGEDIEDQDIYVSPNGTVMPVSARM
jgi:hypothetical protein